MQYTKEQLTKLIDDVEKEFTAHLAKTEENFSSKLAKSEDESMPKKKDKEEHDEEHGHEEHEKSPEHEEHEGHEEGHDEDGCDYDDEDMEHMHKMYMSMGKGELKAHHEAIKKAHEHHGLKKCVESGMEDVHPPVSEGEDSKLPAKSKEVQKSEDCIEPAAPGKIPGAKSPASKTGKATEIHKSEHERRNGGDIDAASPGKIPGAKSPASETGHATEIHKSESNPELKLLKSEVEATKAKNDELKKSLDLVSEFLTKLVKKTAPVGKAITSLDVVAKSESLVEESLSKGEITAILTKKTADPTLKKSDRDLINAYYNGASLNSIAHLLK